MKALAKWEIFPRNFGETPVLIGVQPPITPLYPSLPIPVIWDPVTPPEVVVLVTFESSSARSKYMLWLVHTQQCVVSLYLHNQLITLIFKNTKSKILLKTVRKVSFSQNKSDPPFKI